MSWYKKAKHKIEYSYCGISFTGTISGNYYPATVNEPAEFPEVELVDAKINDLGELVDYIDFSDKFTKIVQDIVKSRATHFGNINQSFSVYMNGINFIIKAETINPGDWEIINAVIMDVQEFLDTLPEKLKQNVEEGILERD